ncbi:hypothetical protein NFI96_026418 [Prochilodus magdalenae]|nr:hypothetical protein NFI96_026418 [Prochilodus magdalenae]
MPWFSLGPVGNTRKNAGEHCDYQVQMAHLVKESAKEAPQGPLVLENPEESVITRKKPGPKGDKGYGGPPGMTGPPGPSGLLSGIQGTVGTIQGNDCQANQVKQVKMVSLGHEDHPPYRPIGPQRRRRMRRGLPAVVLAPPWSAWSKREKGGQHLDSRGAQQRSLEAFQVL